MKIVVFEVEQWEREAFAELEGDHEIVYTDTELDVRVAADYADADIISTFIYSDLDAGVLDQFEHLKLIATRSTGFDHIDTDYARSHDIAICNVPTYGDTTVAEHVFGLLLTISHNLVEATERTRRGDFSIKGLRGFDLRGKTLGVIGTGNIGLCVIEIANGFGMHVVAYDVSHNDQEARRLGFRYLPMNELLSQSDIITLHVPLNKHTHHLISDEQFEVMKRGMILINTSRGQVVDARALVRALAEGMVAAAGLDVLPDEPTIREEAELLRSVYQEEHDLRTLLAGNVLLRLRNVMITPHSAFYTTEAVQRILDTTVDNIQAFIQGEPQNLVPREQG